MVIAEDLAQRLKGVERVMQSLGRSIPIALDEWSLKLPDDLPPGVAAERPAGLRSPFEAGLHGSLLTLREAVGEAAVHNLMERRPKDFGVASRTLLWAYMIGGVGIARDQVVLSPPALMLRLYSTKDTCQSLRTAVDGPRFDVERIDGFFEAKGASSLDASARSHSDGTTIDVLVVNRDLQQDLECPSVFEDATIGGNLDISVLNAPKITTWNSFEEPGRVRIETSQVSANGSELHRRLPAHSITKLTVRVE